MAAPEAEAITVEIAPAGAPPEAVEIEPAAPVYEFSGLDWVAYETYVEFYGGTSHFEAAGDQWHRAFFARHGWFSFYATHTCIFVSAAIVDLDGACGVVMNVTARCNFDRRGC